MKKRIIAVLFAFVIIFMTSGCFNSKNTNENVEWKDYAYKACYQYNKYTICKWIVINESNCSVKSNFGSDYSSATTSGDKCSLSQTSDGKINGVNLWTDNGAKTDYYSFSNGTFTYNNGNGDFHSEIKKFEKDVKK